MKKFLLLIALLCLAAGPASAWIHGSPANGGGVGGSCPNDAAGYADGCDALIAAGHEGLVKHADFFTSYSVTDGHARVGGRPGWNVPGVEYGVGAWTPLVSMIDAISSPPSGCTYVSADKAVECTGSTGATFHVNGYYFNDVYLYVAGAHCGTIDVTDNYFDGGPQTASNFNMLRVEDQGCAQLFQENSNTFDAKGAANNGLAGIVADNRTTAGITKSHKYSAYLNNPSKAFADNVNCANPNIFYNFGTWAFALGSTSHGELGVFCTPSATMAQIDDGFNTQVVNAGDTIGGIFNCQGGLTAFDFMATSSHAARTNFTLINHHHNVLIGNQLTDHSICPNGVYMEAALVFQEGDYGTVNETENWIYAHGGFSCVAENNSSTFGTINWSGNKNMYDGSTISSIDGDSTPCAGASP